jgi:hypothetical protein
MAVKNNLGLLVTPMSIVTVNCLPGNLPNEFIVDISKLDNVGDSIFLKDINLGEGVNLVGTHAKEQILASIASPQKAVEEEVAATPAEGETAAAEGDAAAGSAEGAAGAAKDADKGEKKDASKKDASKKDAGKKDKK